MQYVSASSSGEAVELLTRAGGKGVIMAGGTDLMVEFKEGKICPECFIDVTKAPIWPGSPRRRAPGDRRAATLTRSPARPWSSDISRPWRRARLRGIAQIRNSATLAGNVVSAQPAGDGAMALAPLDPVFTVCSAGGEAELTMGEMYAGFAKSRVDHSRQLVKRISIPLPQKGEAAAFYRLELRKSLSLAHAQLARPWCTVMAKR